MPRLDEQDGEQQGKQEGEQQWEQGEVAERADLRMPLVGAVAWLAGLAAGLVEPWLLAVGAGSMALVAVAVGRARRWGRPTWLTVAGLVLVAAAVVTTALLRQDAVARSPVADLAAERAAVDVVAVVMSDPHVLPGRFGDQVLVRLDVRQVTGRGLRHRLRTPMLLIGDGEWRDVPLGATVSTTGRLSPSDDADVAGVLTGASDPRLHSEPGVWWRAAGAVRESIRESVSGRPDDQRALVPALVDGDDAALDPGLEDDFRTTGLTHLTAVSGTNLTLLVGFLLALARWGGVRGRWLTLVAAAGVVGFLLVARTEPSVLRAAAMGTVGLVALGANGRQRALRGLGVAMVALLMVQPTLATSPGFALSVLATAGIVLLAPGWRDRLTRWLPRWAAEAVAVPAAAQLACTPVIAGLSGAVSLVAVPANLLVAPVVGPATVLGLAGGLLGLVSAPLGHLCGLLAGWCVAWIVVVARAGAALPVAEVGWGTGPLALIMLVALCLLVVVVTPWVAQRPATGVPFALLAVVVVCVRLPTPGWPPAGWVLAMCDIGQGDGLVLRAGPHEAVVVDAGPDPRLIDACLRRLDVDRVPLVVLTHFHADHVDGLSGVLDGRPVGEVWTTSLLDPPDAVDEVVESAGESGVMATLPSETVTRVGDVTLQVLWPRSGPPVLGPGDGSTANDASVVLLVEVRGVRILLTGDVEPPGQAALAHDLPGLEVDVLKVPHHGSRYQDLDWLTSLHADLALVSVGADNDYGHPAGDVLAALEAAGATVARTDEDGDLVVVAPDDPGDRATVSTRG